MEKTKILIVDDHPLFRDGLKGFLSSIDEYVVVGEAGSGTEALELASTLKPDMVFMDIGLPGHDGITATSRLTALFPAIKVIILSMHDEGIYAVNAFKAGAMAYILKGAVSDDLLKALGAINAGRRFASPAIASELIGEYVEILKKDMVVDPVSTLTRREKEVMGLVAKGLSSKEISEKLFISISTVKSHRANLMVKLDAHDIATLVKIALQKGIV